MSHSVGLVIPALHPDIPRLIEYVDSLNDVIAPDTIRIELDDPVTDVQTLRSAVDADVQTVSTRRGKGMAITAGFEALDTDVLAFVDADGSTPPGDVGAILDPVGDGAADITVGSRRLPEAEIIEHGSGGRRLLSAVFAVCARQATGLDLADFQCGAKAMTAGCWRRIRDGLYEAGFGWDLEMLWVAHRRGYDIAEVPIVWEDRPGSTVPPVRTSVSLGGLMGRIAYARLRGRSRTRRSGTPLLGRLDPAVG